MSQPQAGSRSNFIQILLIMGMVFLGVQLFTAPNRETQDKRSAAEIYKTLQDYNRELKDYSAMMELAKYEGKVKEEAKGKPDKEKQVESEILKGYVLYADTALKSATLREKMFKDGKATTNYGYTKLNRAYDKFKPKFEAFHKTEMWNMSVPVAPYGEFTAVDQTPQSIYDQMVTTLSPMAKAEPVFGLFPGYYLIDFLVKLTGSQPWFSYAFAAFLLALVVRAAIWPLAQKQFIWGRQMQQLQPYVKEIQEKYKKKGQQLSQPEQLKMNQEVMDLYKEYGMSPFAGCGPALIQLPLFLTVYQCMLHYKFEFTKGFFLWVHPGSTTFLGIPLASNLGERDYVLIFIYMVSMVTSTMLMPVNDPSNYKQQKLMGVGMALLFSVFMFFYTLPSAFILYWIFTNVLSTTQSLLANRIELPPLQKVSTVAGGAIPTSVVESGSANGRVDSAFFGKTGTPKANKSKKKKKR